MRKNTKAGQVAISVGKITMTEWDPQVVVDQVASRISRGFDQTVLPHLLEAAMNKAPVGKEKNFNPQRGAKSSMKPIELKQPFEKGERFDASERSRLRDLRGLTARELAGEVRSSDIKFFKGKAYKNKGGFMVTEHAGRTPDLIETTRGGYLRGAFAHTPGTLRDSHVIVQARREGTKVVGKVRATADYARAIHEGFAHKGGRDKTGKTTRIKGRAWLREALEINANADLTNPSTYEG